MQFFPVVLGYQFRYWSYTFRKSIALVETRNKLKGKVLADKIRDKKKGWDGKRWTKLSLMTFRGYQNWEISRLEFIRLLSIAQVMDNYTLIHKDAAEILKAQYKLAIKQAKTHFFIELLHPHYGRLSDLPTSNTNFWLH